MPSPRILEPASGKRSAGREKLVRFQGETAMKIAEPGVLADLRKAMSKVDKKLKALRSKVSDVKDDNGLQHRGAGVSTKRKHRAC